MKITAGIDAGMEYTKVVLLKENGSFVWQVAENRLEPTQSVVGRAVTAALGTMQIAPADVSGWGVTSVGQEEIGFPARVQPGFYCLSRGADFLTPGAETVVDMGSRKTLALRCERGIARKTAAGEKCASGAGAYLNMVASFLELDLAEMDRLYFQTQEEIVLETKCAVFAESEIISLIHRKVPMAAIVRGAFNGLAQRVRGQLLGLAPAGEICMVGGVAMLPAARDALQRAMQCPVRVPEEPRIACALGAALLCMEEEGGGKL